MKKDKRLDEILKMTSSIGYGYYCSNPADRVIDKLFSKSFNCSDVCPASRERVARIRELMQPTRFTDFMDTYSGIVGEFHDLVVEEVMFLTGWSESRANQWFNHYVDVCHVEIKYDGVSDVLVFKPVFLSESKYS